MAQAPIRGGRRGQIRVTSVYPGAGRNREDTGKQELSYHWTPCKLCRSAHALPPRAPRPLGTGTLQFSTLRELLAAELEIWLLPFFFSPFSLERCSTQGTRTSQGKQLTLSPTSWQGVGQLHLRISAAGCTPRRPVGRKGEQQVY